MRPLLVVLVLIAVVVGTAFFLLASEEAGEPPVVAAPSQANGGREVVADIVEPAPAPEPEPEPEVSPRERGGVSDILAPEKPEAVIRTRGNSTLAELQGELERAQVEFARRRELLGRAEWSKGDWIDRALADRLPNPARTWDGVAEEFYYRRARNADGEPILRGVWLPFDAHPEFYDLKRELLRLQTEIRVATPD